MSLSVKEERDRAKRLMGQPYREGHFRLDGKIVRVSATFYPSIAWWIETVAAPSMTAVPGTREPLTALTYARLEAFT